MLLISMCADYEATMFPDFKKYKYATETCRSQNCDSRSKRSRELYKMTECSSSVRIHGVQEMQKAAVRLKYSRKLLQSRAVDYPSAEAVLREV